MCNRKIYDNNNKQTFPKHTFLSLVSALPWSMFVEVFVNFFKIVETRFFPILISLQIIVAGELHPV